jgi:esterase
MAFELHHQIVAADGAAARGRAVFLHGILGQGANWRTTAQRLVRRDPSWSAVLVDLRLHGQSQGAPPPHSLGAAADDVRRLIDRLGAEGPPVRAVVGHSFGGKVALAVRDGAPPDLVATAVFDASPSARPGAELQDLPGSVVSVIRVLATVPRRFERRDDLVTALAERGITQPVGKWLAMSLTPDAGGYVLPFDQASLEALLADYFEIDLWSAVERSELPGEITFYIAGRSDTVPAADRARLLALAPRVTTRIFPDADHWMLGERDSLELPSLP